MHNKHSISSNLVPHQKHEHMFVSGGNHHLTSRFYEVVLDSTTILTTSIFSISKIVLFILCMDISLTLQQMLDEKP